MDNKLTEHRSAQDRGPSEISIVHIRPAGGWAPLNAKELWEYRDLLFFFAWRDLKVRYKQTALGVTWAFLKPLSLVAVFSVVFGWLAKIPSDGIPYPLFSLCAVLPWQLFSHILSGASQSMVADQNLLTKVYFPRLISPMSVSLSSLADFIVAAGALIALLVYFHVLPTPYVWTIPLFVALAVMTALGTGLWCSALNVRYRDVGHALPFLTQMWFFATPIAYPSSLVPEPWRIWYGLNPMASVVEGFRWAVLGTDGLPAEMLLVSLSMSAVLCVSGLYYFRRMEETFADVV
ncbi:MAG: ABC transporter permease [Nitrospira sp.]|nr:ABC transporter permease [Nitrospira sp.]